jgi:SAM-dependent methyltransferase
MAHPQQQAFVAKVKNLYPDHFVNKTVVEFGSLNLNGTVRDFFTNCQYTGVDLVEGDGVDVVSRCHEYFRPDERPDTVISCEMLEHDEHWDESLKHMASILNPGGLLVITCATDGRTEHGTTDYSPADSPATNDYYRNKNMHDITDALFDFLWSCQFDVLHMEINRESKDLYVYAIKKQ